MWQLAAEGATYLMSQSLLSLLHLFWFVLVFEFPRYTLGFISVAVIKLRRTRGGAPVAKPLHVSVVIAGHNEADSIGRCVRSVREQSRAPDQIVVVSDGSTDSMPRALGDLQRQGLIDEGHCTQVRAGKSAATNLAVTRSIGDVVVNVDCDCTFDRNALKEIIAPFSDPEVGGVAGNILVRNPHASVVTAFQTIEYLISISQGKQAANLTDQMTCVSGAFGAFRRSALVQVGGLDAGGGEDLDVTLRLRQAGWKTVFAPDAICYTDVPVTLAALVRQRFRWERDALRLRYRKHGELMNPFSPRFRTLELMHELDFIIFNVIAAAAFPFYILWLFATYGDLAPVILLGAQAGLLVLDAFTFLLAASMTPKANVLTLSPYIVGYSVIYGFVMRFVRLAAYIEEWVFEASYRDPYVPHKVHRARM